MSSMAKLMIAFMMRVSNKKNCYVSDLNHTHLISILLLALVTVEFASLYIDAGMTQTIHPPPSQAILDLDKMTLAGTLSQGVTVVVPSGLFHAAGSIILRHPDAQLVFQPGVRIMFAKHATIRVDYGVLKVLGEVHNPVILAPTQNFTSEYGNDEIENTTVFDGIYFGPNSNGTETGQGNQYISGSILSHCEIHFGGYFKSDKSVYINSVSVMMNDVLIWGDWSRYVDGIYIQYPSSVVLLDGVVVRNAGSYGVYIYSAHDGATLSNVQVHGCRHDGVHIENSGSTVIAHSVFRDSGGDQVYIYDSGIG